ncbi:hypothetical protein Tco_1477695, partial [Tanacetum coccineum]
MEDRGIFDSGCSGHMTGNKDHLDDFEEYKGGSVTFRRDLDQLAQKHLREVTNDKATSTNSVNSGSEPANTQPADQDDSDIPELTIFNKPQKEIFDEASYDEEGMVHDFNNLPTEVAVSPIPTLRIHNIHPQSQILGDPKSSVQTRSRVQQHSGAHALEEPKKISEALKDDSWVEAMECTSKGTNDGKKRDSFYQDQGARKKEQNQNCLLTMDDGVVNWGEHTVEEVETNHALMAISSNNEKKILLTNLLYSRFFKDVFKGVNPLTGDYTPQPQQEIDDSLYVYGKNGPQKPETSVSDENFNENSVTSNKKVVSKPKPKEVEPS